MSSLRPVTSWSRSAIGHVAVISATVAIAACGSSGTTSVLDSGSSGANGAAVYAASCASCHGDDLRGTDKGPSHLSIVYEPNHHSDESFRAAIANGAPQHHWNFGDMEPVRGLSNEDVDAVIAFIRSEQARLGFDD